MKKLLLATVIGLTLASCEFETSIRDYRNKGNMPVQSVKHFDYKGLNYIFFQNGGGKWAVGGVVHDPDCKCKGRKEEKK